VLSNSISVVWSEKTLMELLNTKTSHRLEWIIIIVGLSSVTVVRAPGNCDRFLGVFFLLAAQEGETLANQDERDLKGDELFRPAIIIVGLSSVTVVRAPGNCDRSNAD
jgi:hypothetical protein